MSKISIEEFVEMYMRLSLSRLYAGSGLIENGFEIKKVNASCWPIYSMRIPDKEHPMLDDGCGMNTIRVDIPMDKQIHFPNPFHPLPDSVGFTLIFGYNMEHKMIVYTLRG